MKKTIPTIDMSKKDYIKPTMRVVKLQNKALLLSGSNEGSSSPSNPESEEPQPKTWYWQVD